MRELSASSAFAWFSLFCSSRAFAWATLISWSLASRRFSYSCMRQADSFCMNEGSMGSTGRQSWVQMQQHVPA